jgi:hypothetical protein
MTTTPHGRLLAASLFLALCTGLAPGGGWLMPAHAQARSSSAPVIQGLEVNADAGLSPGSTLEFTVRGTPKSIARVQVTGSSLTLPLKETRPGVYTGSHTVRKSERGLVAGKLIRADLTANGRTSTANFSFPPSFAAEQQAGNALPAGPRVDRFVAEPVARLEPGAELKFTLQGTPGSRASVQLPGLPLTIPLREISPGYYSGSYTLRKADVVGSGPVVATLRSGERVVTAQLAAPLSRSATASAAPVAPAAPATMGAAPASALTLQVTSPGPNAVIDASQAVLQGRTAPGANVHVKVDAVLPSAPGRMSVAQSVTEQTVQADGNGNFSLNFGPQRFAPGTRFEVQLSARQGTQATPGQRLVLYQRQG